MNISHVAKAVLERRQRMNPTVFQGEIVSEITPDGLSEALNRRWLIPSMETGYLQVTNDLNLVAEMEESCKGEHDCPEEYGDDHEEDDEYEKAEKKATRESSDESDEEEDDEDSEKMSDDEVDDMTKKERKRAGEVYSRTKADHYESQRHFVALHANKVMEDMYGGSTMGAPVRNSTSTPVSSPQQQQQRQTPNPDVGSDVTVVENGRTYQGRVQAKTDDGKYRVSFTGGEQPAQARDYEATELGTPE